MAKKSAFLLLILFLFLLPFHAFLVTVLNEGLGFDSIIITAWREIFIGILTILAGIHVISKTREKSCISPLDKLILIFFLFGLVFFFYKRESLMQWMLGARYDFEFFYLYLLIRVFGFGKRQLTYFLKSIIISSVIVVMFGFIIYFLPQNFLESFGYASYQDEWTAKSGVFSCHYIEFDQSFCRLQSTFGSPGRYGLYLLFVIALSGILLISTQIRKKQFFLSALLIASLISLYLTFSRAAWIGLFAMLIAAAYPFLKYSPKIRKNIKEPLKNVVSLRNCSRKYVFQRFPWKIVAGTLIFIVIIGIPLVNSKIFQSKIIRSASTKEHFISSYQGMITALQHPFGIGLGKAGPASFHFEKFLTENAFLQIIVEMGFLAGAFFIAIFIQLLIHLHEMHQKARSRTEQIISYTCFLTIIGLMASGLFVHSFENMSLMLMVFGISGSLGLAKDNIGNAQPKGEC